MFFVISGYWMTTILIEDVKNKRLSIVNFTRFPVSGRCNVNIQCILQVLTTARVAGLSYGEKYNDAALRNSLRCALRCSKACVLRMCVYLRCVR